MWAQAVAVCLQDLSEQSVMGFLVDCIFAEAEMGTMKLGFSLVYFISHESLEILVLNIHLLSS